MHATRPTLLALVGFGLVLGDGPRDSRAEAPPLLPIGTIQGVVSDQDDGQFHVTTLHDQRVRVRGIVHALGASNSSVGRTHHGFFIQNADAQSDRNPLSSDAIFVDTGLSPFLEGPTGPFAPIPGDELVIEGTVFENFALTALNHAVLVERLGHHPDLDDVLKAFDADPPSDGAAAARYWERREGMRARIADGAQAQAGRHDFGSSHSSEIYLVAATHPILRRGDPYSRRVFRDPHPLDDQPESRFDNDNAYRLLIGDQGLKAASRNPRQLLPPVRTFDRLTAPLTGPVVHAFGKYAIHPMAMPVFEPGADPSATTLPSPPSPGTIRVASYNLENLFDFRDNPGNLTDFPGNPGSAYIQPPFNWLPASQEEYASRVRRLARHLVEELHAPDIILVQEVENQDIGGLANGRFVLSDRLQGNGKLDALEDLVQTIADAGGPLYDSAADLSGGDIRGIISAVLFRSDRFALSAVPRNHPLLATNPKLPFAQNWAASIRQSSNPKAFNADLPGDLFDSVESAGRRIYARPPQVARLKRLEGGSDAPALYIMSNHFTARPDQRIAQRREQARILAHLCKALIEHDPKALIIAGGDLNVYPRPDDPTPWDISDQLAPLYEVAGLKNLYDLILAGSPAAAYSYVYQGQAGTLDHLFVSPALVPSIGQLRYVHVNSDWTAGDARYPLRALSDHDPLVVDFTLP